MDKKYLQISEDELTAWAETCVHINHLCTLVQRELKQNTQQARTIDLVERARKRAWDLLNELVERGAKKPEGYREPD